MKRDLNNLELLDGNWSQLCITCKVSLFLLSNLWFSPKIDIFLKRSDLSSINRLSGLYAQNTAPHVTAVLSNSIIIALGYRIALER